MFHIPISICMSMEYDAMHQLRCVCTRYSKPLPTTIAAVKLLLMFGAIKWINRRGTIPQRLIIRNAPNLASRIDARAGVFEVPPCICAIVPRAAVDKFRHARVVKHIDGDGNQLHRHAIISIATVWCNRAKQSSFHWGRTQLTSWSERESFIRT